MSASQDKVLLSSDTEREISAEGSVSGWARHPRERRDVFHRIRCFPPEIVGWRKELVTWVQAEADLFPVGQGADLDEIRRQVDYGVSRILEITRILCLLEPETVRPSEEAPASKAALRVLARLGPFRGLGLEPSRLPAAKRGRVLSRVVPPNLRSSLFELLKTHSRRVCSPRKPECSSCEVASFCADYRARAVLEAEASDAPTVVDLFSGAGGSSEGFRRAGFRPLLALDLNEAALRTYSLNHPEVPDDRVVCADIAELPPGELANRLAGIQVDVVTGSPPCQGFSSVGYRGKGAKLNRDRAYHPASEDRNHLFEHMINVVLELNPGLVLLENVPGMNSVKRSASGGRGAKWDRSFLEWAGVQLQERGGYRYRIVRLNASAFGVPQDRLRTFLVASRLRTMPPRPEEDYQDLQKQNFDVDLLPPIGLLDAIYDLPPLQAGGGLGVMRWEPGGALQDRRCRRYLKKFGLLRSESPILHNHNIRYHNPSDLELYELLEPGENSVHAVEKYRRDDLMKYRKDAHDDKYFRLRENSPSKTIVAHLAKDGNGYIHPKQVRSISLREAARVQSFHDGYVFCGSPSEQFAQVGNAVPPLVAEALAKTFKRALDKENKNGQ